MATQSCVKLNKKSDDEWYTPRDVWQPLAENFIPKDKVLWEPFLGDGKSTEHLRSFGFEVISTDEDFFECNYGDIVVTNPPFSKTEKVLKRLVELQKPFILILPDHKLGAKYMNKVFLGDPFGLDLLIPGDRIEYIRKQDETDKEGTRLRVPFNSIFDCWKIPTVPKGMTFLPQRKPKKKTRQDKERKK